MSASVEKQIPEIIDAYGLYMGEFAVERIGSGYIHHTFKLSGKQSYILQRVNKNVFREPEIIAANLRHASEYLKKNHPEYPFLTALQTSSGKDMAYDAAGYPWRLFPFFDNTFTVDKVTSADDAFRAAAEFGRLTKNLDGISVSLFKPTIDRFHDLSWRYEQFEEALDKSTPTRMKEAEREIEKSEKFIYLVREYESLINSKKLKSRITHNDTKINNVLFDSTTQQTVCAIDLDTLMPGYFIYDLGDMIRTFVSPVDEEEKDTSKIFVRKNIYDALIQGYLSQMDDTLSPDEKRAIPFSGLMMTYIMALRMLTDFLNGDVYYQIRYDGQNLVRAKNQLKLLDELTKC